jgi:methionyl-tRNA formyltransferase
VARFKIVFMGTPDFAVPALNALVEGPDSVEAVVTQPDRPRGRGRKLVPSPVKELALKVGISVLQPERVREPSFIEQIRALRPDLLVVAAFGQILPPDLLAVPALMPVNIHASLLPALRGAAPMHWAILNGLEMTGITIMKMDEGMDTGDILLQKGFPLDEDETFGSLFPKMQETGASLLMKALDMLERGSLKPVKQPEEGVTMAPPLKKEMFHIDWNDDVLTLHRKMRAFDPSPGAWTEWNGQRIRLFSPFVIDLPLASDVVPGTVVEAGDNGIVVSASNGAIGAREIQYPGKRRMECADFLRGRRIEPGELFQ